MSPLSTATWQAGALAAISNVLGQATTCYQNNRPLTIDFVDFGQFVLFTVLTTPPNFVWQAWLEATFPGYAVNMKGQEKEQLVDEVTTGTSNVHDEKASSRPRDKAMMEKSTPVAANKQTSNKQLNLRNTAIKFTLDQTVGAAVNTVLFLAGMAMLRGESLDSITRRVVDGFWPLMFAGQKLWPAVSVISFTMIPVESRTTFGSIIGLFWGIYLSILASKSTR